MRKYNWTTAHFSFRLILATTMILGFSATSLIPTPAGATPSSQRFELLRSHEEFTVPANVFVLTFEASGATGQWGWDNAALVTGSVTVTPGEVLKVYVGGAGHPTMGAGGYPNGGAGGGNNGEIIAGGGGGFGRSLGFVRHRSEFQVFSFQRRGWSAQKMQTMRGLLKALVLYGEGLCKPLVFRRGIANRSRA